LRANRPSAGRGRNIVSRTRRGNGARTDILRAIGCRGRVGSAMRP